MEEVPLRGGRVTPGVVRVGKTVRRPAGPRSEFVRQLLRHLASVGFDGAPTFLGIDDQGREILSLLPGEPLPGTVILTDEQLRSAARLLHRYHDATASAPRELRGTSETVIHGDVGPWNILWQGEAALALIDFDEARPGDRLSDVAYFGWKGLRLNAAGPPAAEQRRRLTVFAEAAAVTVDAALFEAIDSAYESMIHKGLHERWATSVIREVETERSWYREAFAAH
jgi:phosphotransferase family enzyme